MHRPLEPTAYETDSADHLPQPGEFGAAERRLRDAAPVSDRAPGIRNVELTKINATDIQSAADFKDPQHYAELHREAQMLRQMEPALQQGADVETFHAWDQANGIGWCSPGAHVRGYADVYHSHYDIEECVALDAKADGTYDVLNGRHRIVAARDAGLKEIPARVRG